VERPLLASHHPNHRRTFRLSALFCDNCGNELVRIEQNVWRSSSVYLDVEVEGRRINLSHRPSDNRSVLRSEPPTTLVLERVDMFFMGTRVLLEEGSGLSFTGPTGTNIRLPTDATVTWNAAKRES